MLSGFNLVGEIVNCDLMVIVIVVKDLDVCCIVQDLFGCEYFRVYVNVDIYGVELVGVLKNIYVIVVGFVLVFDMGENVKVMLIICGLVEMSWFVVFLGVNLMIFMGLVGVGDFIVICILLKSCNFWVGYVVGKGKDFDDVVVEFG